MDPENILFQQEGAICHTARIWPPKSSGLTPCDFLLWKVLKSRVCVNKLRTISELIFDDVLMVKLRRNSAGESLKILSKKEE